MKELEYEQENVHLVLVALEVPGVGVDEDLAEQEDQPGQLDGINVSFVQLEISKFKKRKKLLHIERTFA